MDRQTEPTNHVHRSLLSGLRDHHLAEDAAHLPPQPIWLEFRAKRVLRRRLDTKTLIFSEAMLVPLRTLTYGNIFRTPMPAGKLQHAYQKAVLAPILSATFVLPASPGVARERRAHRPAVHGRAVGDHALVRVCEQELRRAVPKSTGEVVLCVVPAALCWPSCIFRHFKCPPCVSEC